MPPRVETAASSRRGRFLLNGLPGPPHVNVAQRLPLLYARRPRAHTDDDKTAARNTRANADDATTAYATTAAPSADAVHRDGARIASAGKYPTKPAGIAVK